MASPKPKLDLWVREPERQPFDGAAWNRYANFGNGDLIAPQTWRTDSDLLGFEWDPELPRQIMRVNTQLFNNEDGIGETTDDLDFRMFNTRWFSGRNAADTATVNMMRLNGSDQIEIGMSANQVRVLGPAFFLGAVTLGDAPADIISVLGTMTVTPLATFLAGILISGGNLAFAPSGTPQRITGNLTFGDANRLLIQTSTVNGQSFLGLVPNGTGIVSSFQSYALSNPAASAYIQMAAVSGTDVRIQSAHTGAAYLPLTFWNNNLKQMEIGATGDIVIGGPTSNIQIGGAAGDIVVGSDSGDVVIGADPGNKFGMFGEAGDTQQTIEDEATDPATTMALANSIREILLAYAAVAE